ncbi:6-bladed beta-propeller [Pedobacter sp. P351]|uniref:6-bladed beta-propeller n=1 Tax=Pedobacter superstes TaxID=3133441 RepID=UPI0030A9E196
MILFINLSPIRIKPLYALAVFIFLSFNAFSQAGKVDSSGMLTLRIDPQSARGANVSAVFDEVRFIPLETTKESLFGSIYDLKIVKDQFVLFDYDTRAVLIFAKDGKFKGKIDASKIPKDDADKSKTELYGYKIVEENKDSVIAIYSSKYFFYFDFNGKQIKKVLHKDAVFNQEFKLADQETTVIPRFLEKKGKDSIHYELAIIRKDKDTVGYFPFSMKRYQTDEFWDNAKFYDNGNKNGLFFINVYGYDLYKVSPSKLSLAYHIIFPANNSLPRDFISNPIYIKKRREYFQANPKVFYSLNNTYQVGDHLYLQMRNFGREKELKKAIIYNLKTTEIISLQDLQPDSLSSFLPVTDAGAFYDFSNKGFHLYKDDYFYTSYSSLAMFSFKEQLGDKNIKFSPQMQEYFKTQDRKSNPVIIQLKPKKN